MGQLVCFRRLSRMRMFAATVHFKFFADTPPQRIFRQHTFYGKFDYFVRLACHQVFERTESCSAHVARVMEIFFLIVALARYFYLRSVDNDNEVAAVNMRRVKRFVLAAQKRGNLRRNAPQRFTGGVDNPPRSLNIRLAGRLRNLCGRFHLCLPILNCKHKSIIACKFTKFSAKHVYFFGH